MCENAKILCPYCLTREIDPAQAICSACYSKEDKLERGSWDDLRKRKNADEIQMFTIAKKVDEAFQVPENKAYTCREKRNDSGRGFGAGNGGFSPAAHPLYGGDVFQD